MVKEYKNHKFISMEKMAKLLNCDEVCIWFNKSQQDLIERKHLYVNSNRFVKTGYAQYAINGIDDWYFDFECITKKKDFESNSYKSGAFANINQPLQTVMNHLGYSTSAKKVKPIYKLTYRYSGEVVDCEPINIAGTVNAQMIGILVKY